eukprot:GFUD01033681.1.p1 GENE.GFUD01033681.1~~GFUD01033681.1.p1  ORF type:complete len:651 (+),score=200.56 GFUD01033681.1:172-1953(+)
MQNDNFESFYKAQNVCSEADFPAMMDAFRSGLPSVFRVVSTKPESELLKEKLKLGHLSGAGATPVSWYGGDQVWRLDNTRWDLRDQEEMKLLHRFIVDQDKLGNIYRQEQVSMVPVKCLDIQPHHTVLDMCASPGSKTGQVLEALHAGGGSVLPTGCVIASEPDIARCSNLCGNMSFYQSPCLMVVNHSGQVFPDLTYSDGAPVLYDHVVCDVPCSGDGTIRKNPNIWAGWHPGRGNSRFSLQLNIARRGLELLKEGGTMAYSSCSINQVENEAVVARLLLEAEGNLELVDMSGKFPGLEWLPGLSDWKVIDTHMKQYSNFEDVPPNLRSQLRREMFPPDSSTGQSLMLERCMRFLPHLNDDGGFFVAIIRKTGPVKIQDKQKIRWEKKDGMRVEKKFNKPKLDKLLSSVNDFNFVPDDSELLEKVVRSMNYLGLGLPKENLYTYQKTQNSVRLVSPSLRSILHSGNHQLKIGSTPGVKILSSNRMACASNVPFHPRGSSYHMIASYVSKRIVSGQLEDTRLLLDRDMENSLEIEQLSLNLRELLGSMEPGWFTYNSTNEKLVLECPAYFSEKKIFLMLGAKSRKHYKFMFDI